MNKRVFYIVVFSFAYSFSFGQNKYPANVEAVLAKSKSNSGELEKAIAYFKKPSDSLKLKAIYFLIANMDIHFSETYYWADSLGNKIPFNESDYPDFQTSIKAFDSLKIIFPKIHPIPVRIKDIDTIKADYLINNTELAFKEWNSSTKLNKIDFNTFCEYILPYRISVEPLQDWRKTYQEKYSFVTDSSLKKPLPVVLKYLINSINEWFTCTYNMEVRKEPLPRLGSLQLLMRKKGLCEDVADLTVFSLRSQGIPATVDVVPYWATSTGGHSLNTTFSDYKAIPFDVLLKGDSLNEFIREPAKVLRITYSKQSNTIASLIDPDAIPSGMLRSTNYKDVTSEYWKTQDLTCPVLKYNDKQHMIYSCVFNGSEWRAAWWGVSNDDSVTFTNLAKGAVYLPMFYLNGKLRPAGSPVAAGYDKTIVLEPDTINRHSITIKELENYLIFRPGKRYTLWYWNYHWIKIETKIAPDNTKEIVFANVPKNALLLLRPEYSNNKERPFIITDQGERLWW